MTVGGAGKAVHVMRRNLGSIVGYGVSVVLTAIVTLLTIPVVVAHSGATGWANLALGQAIGVGCGVLVGFGWGTTGPTAVATADSAGRARIYAESLRARSLLAIPGVVVAVALTLAITDVNTLEACITAVSFTLTGLMAGWYFTGSSRPYAFLLLDTAPRVLGNVAGAVALVAGAQLVVFPVMQVTGVVVGIVLSSGVIRGTSRGAAGPFSLRGLGQLLRAQSHGMVIAGVTAVYTTVPISVVALVAPAALPAYALADKVLRFATTAFSPVVQFFQGWVPNQNSEVVYRRIKAAYCFGLGLTALASVVFVLGLPWFAALLSGGEIVPGFGLSVLFGIVLVLLVMGQVTGLVCLLALGRGQKLAIFTAIGAGLGIPAVIVGAHLFGAEGAAAGLVLAELAALSPQTVLLGKLMAQRRGGRITRPSLNGAESSLISVAPDHTEKNVN